MFSFGVGSFFGAFALLLAFLALEDAVMATTLFATARMTQPCFEVILP